MNPEGGWFERLPWLIWPWVVLCYWLSLLVMDRPQQTPCSSIRRIISLLGSIWLIFMIDYGIIKTAAICLGRSGEQGSTAVNWSPTGGELDQMVEGHCWQTKWKYLSESHLQNNCRLGLWVGCVQSLHSGQSTHIKHIKPCIVMFPS